ncbi:hypothetical protein IAQ61_010802 [Plenodomus lingam]|uniref:uncharacterized protein n=1 Tax=Leptosphaeria maculans TaxID=5022 RepID=UPI0033208F09|nr:hypothetical protein IAQ61_010802 [Plenodomus lingam]
MSGRDNMADRSHGSTSRNRRPPPVIPPSSLAESSLPTKHWRLPHDLAAPSRIRPLTSQCLYKPNYNVKQNGLYFQNAGESQRSMSSFQWLPPTNDVSIPLTDEQDCQVVTEIVDAMKDMSKAKDTVASAYRKRFTPPEHYYQDWAIEACAWDVLVSIIQATLPMCALAKDVQLLAKQIHTGGFNSRIYDSALIDAIGETQHWHFEDRIGWICMALRVITTVNTARRVPAYLITRLRRTSP